MVTASASALPSPPAVASATIAAPLNPSTASTSFQSVYQSLPVPRDESAGGAAAASSHGKEPGGNKGLDGGKKGPSDSAANKLPAIAAAATPTDLPPQRPWTPALPAFSQTAQALAGQAASAVAASPAAEDSMKLPAAHEASGVAANILETALPPSQDRASNPALAPAIATSLRQKAPSGERASNGRAPHSNPPESLILQPIRVPGLAQSTADSSRGSTNSAAPQPAIATAVTGKGLAASIVPHTENLAFSLRLADLQSPAHRAQAAPQPSPVRTQPSIEAKSEAKTETKNEERLAATDQVATASRASSPEQLGQLSNGTVTLSWNEASGSYQNMSTEVRVSEPQEPTHSSVVAALHDIQPILPEVPKPNTTGEILLQLGGKDQSAAIRVTDRAGAINVSVHAADPDLRASLRSNLGELASQLTHQGWKTEVVKQGTVLTRSETPHDSSPDGQRSSGQRQQFANGERQSQRDRRENSGQWRMEFEEHTSGNSGQPGGKT